MPSRRVKTVWLDGPSHLLFDAIELLEKLAAITPRPAIHVVRYHGVRTPQARWRSQVVRYGRAARARRPHVARSAVLLSMLPLPPAGASPRPRSRTPPPAS